MKIVISSVGFGVQMSKVRGGQSGDYLLLSDHIGLFKYGIYQALTNYPILST